MSMTTAYIARVSQERLREIADTYGMRTWVAIHALVIGWAKLTPEEQFASLREGAAELSSLRNSITVDSPSVPSVDVSGSGGGPAPGGDANQIIKSPEGKQ